MPSFTYMINNQLHLKLINPITLLNIFITSKEIMIMINYIY